MIKNEKLLVLQITLLKKTKNRVGRVKKLSTMHEDLTLTGVQVSPMFVSECKKKPNYYIVKISVIIKNVILFFILLSCRK